jgi:wobble nucleotide-excising tRNase
MTNQNNDREVYTPEQIQAAKEIRDSLIKRIVTHDRCIYMAGEIVMWDQLSAELEAAKKELQEAKEQMMQSLRLYESQNQTIIKRDKQLKALQVAAEKDDKIFDSQRNEIMVLKALLNKQNADMVRLNGEIKKLKDTLSEVEAAVISSFCDCEAHTFYEWEKDENKCSVCSGRIYKQNDL